MLILIIYCCPNIRMWPLWTELQINEWNCFMVILRAFCINNLHYNYFLGIEFTKSSRKTNNAM